MIELNKKENNVLALAYLGDAVYELWIRNYLMKQGIAKVKDFQKEAIQYVSAKNQCYFLKNMIDSHFFTEEELQIIYRARNHKSHKAPKNTDVSTYKYATGLEALLGHLELSQKQARIIEIMEQIVAIKQEMSR